MLNTLIAILNRNQIISDNELPGHGLINYIELIRIISTNNLFLVKCHV